MGRRWVSDDGHEIEAIVLDACPLLRVDRRYGGHRYHVGYFPTVEALAMIVDIATLTEIIDFPRRPA
ncbi:hypothetical protein [Spongiactinospora sp. TRM90649]|uniref:hypothetical protein n=1 Tax=Spongiactinospora sp. TRM90649 TaxID=3031114 RepID=UPI0023F633C9|nr:hypothetical protein [Spongiactinospora sp. TRM90649]MDF5757749.1 hypothetical protein [Spongiactinospora sp. TRM90649]